MPSYGDTRDWKHRELALPVGDRTFIFRTMSLYDAQAAWPLARPMVDSLQLGKPAQWGDCLVALLEVLCPELLRSPAFKEFGGAQVDALLEFYSGQDWGRLSQLSVLNEESEEPEEKTDPRTAFVVLCVAAAKFANMTVVEFAESRFEFCADVFVALSGRIRDEKVSGEHLTLDELRMNLDQVIEGADATYGPATAPAWFKGLIENVRTEAIGKEDSHD